MATQDIMTAPTNAPDTSRRLSAGLWRDCPFEHFRGRPGEGTFIFDDFAPAAQMCINQVSNAYGKASLGQWAAWFGTATLTAVDAGEEGGVLKLDTSTTDANKSIILSSMTSPFRFMGASTAYNFVGGRFWMEFRIALGSVAASKQGVFVGVADVTSGQPNASDTTIIASGGNVLQASDSSVTKNLFGFFNRTTTNPTDFSVVYAPAAGAAVYPTGLNTLATTVGGAAMTAYAGSTDKGKGTGFVKIGLAFDPTGLTWPFKAAPATCPATQTAGTLYRPVMKFYVNGVEAAAFLDKATLQSALFPLTGTYAPVFQYMNIANASAPAYLDWVAFAQEASF